MKITYDKAADAVYIYLIDIPPGGVAKTQPIDPSINLDFDAEGKLVGIEVLDASKKLPNEILQKPMYSIGFSRSEMTTINNALNEITGGPDAIEDWEFHTRIGATKDEALRLLRRIHESF